MERAAEISWKELLAILIGVFGIFYVTLSVISGILVLGIVGTAMLSVGMMVLYVTRTKHIPIDLLSAAAISASGNLERTLTEANLPNKGRYLPPSVLNDSEASMVVIPEQLGQPLPKPEEFAEEGLLSSSQDFLFVTPPGLGLCKLFEKELGVSFSNIDLNFVLQKLPKLLTEKMELAEKASMQVDNDCVVLELTGNAFKDSCQESRKQSRTHDQIGCLLGSAVACVLAKASGKVVTIQKDEQSYDGKTTKLEYLLEEN